MEVTWFKTNFTNFMETYNNVIDYLEKNNLKFK